jgi:hypothetical protein
VNNPQSRGEPEKVLWEGIHSEMAGTFSDKKYRKFVDQELGNFEQVYLRG